MKSAIRRLASFSVACLTLSGCHYYAAEPVVVTDPPPASDTVSSYIIDSVYTEGVDDPGNMWLEIRGAFSSWKNNVDLSCDGYHQDPEIMIDSPSMIVVAVPAASYYDRCSFTVYSSYDSSPTFVTSITAMDFTGSSVAADSDPSFVDVRIYGDFYVSHLLNSQISVLASCDGGNHTFHPDIVYRSFTEIDVAVPNPGSGFRSDCQFVIQDTFTDGQNNVSVVSSPTLLKRVWGI